MPVLLPGRPFYEAAGLAFFLLQLSLFVLILPPFHYGTWYEVEPVMLGLFVLVAMNALWLAVGFGAGWLGISRPLHPLLLCLAAWVGWQWLVTAQSPLPLRAWLGHPAIGEGAAYHTALLLAYLTASALWRKPAYQKTILAVAAFDLLGIAWHYFNPAIFCNGGGGWERGKWASYLAFMVAWLWIAYMASREARTPARHVWMVASSVFILLWVARSKTAVDLFEPMIIGGGIILWLRLAQRPAWLRVGRFWRLAAITGGLLPLGWIGVSQASHWLQVAECSLPMRALFNQASVAVIAHEPSRLLIGNGFGRYVDDVFLYALVDGAHTFQNGNRASNWSIIDGHAFHPHDEVMEQVLALGLPGLLLWLMLPLIALWHMPRRLFWWCAPMLVAVTALQSFWFFQPPVFAYQVLWMTAVSARNLPVRRMLPGRLPAGLCALLAVVMAWSAHEEWRGIAYGERLSHAVVMEPAANYSMDWLSEDFASGGDRFRAAADFYMGWTAGRIASHELDERDAGWYLLLMHAAHRAALSPQSGAWLASTDMCLLNHLFEQPERSLLDRIKPQARGMLTESVLAISHKAPLRDDITASFFYSLDGFTGGDKVRALDIIKKTLQVAPDHRPALWALGQLLLTLPGHEEEGREMMRRAVELGLERVYPVTAAEVAPYR